MKYKTMEKNRIKRFNENSELNISDVSDSENINLTTDEKIWLSKIVWFYENEKGFDSKDIFNQKSIFSKLKID